MITGITVISPLVESRANRMAPHFHPDLCRRRVHSALCCGCVSRGEPAAAALDVFALAHTAVIHSDWLTDFFCTNHQAPTTPPVAPPTHPPTPSSTRPEPHFPEAAAASQSHMRPFRASGLCSSAGNWSHHCATGGWGGGGLQQALGEVRWPRASCPSSAPASSLAALYGDQTWKQLSCVFLVTKRDEQDVGLTGSF